MKHFPQCRLDTELFDTVERMLTEGKTSDDNLMTVAAKAGEFYGTMPSLRGKTLAETPRLTIQGALMSGYERDDRICLIYKAAMLQKEVDCPPKRQLPNPLDTSPKKPKANWILSSVVWCRGLFKSNIECYTSSVRKKDYPICSCSGTTNSWCNLGC